jgi:hypothetical protein
VYAVLSEQMTDEALGFFFYSQMAELMVENWDRASPIVPASSTSSRSSCNVGELMPNGHDRPYGELLMLCASYRLRFGEWPERVDLTPSYLYALTCSIGRTSSD